MAKNVSWFKVIFAIYTAFAVVLLLPGIGVALASASPPVLELMETWKSSGVVLLATLGRGVAHAVAAPEGDNQVVLDYLLSVINLVVGIFLVWRRPNDWTARLLSLGMVGTAMAYNFQVHGFLIGALDLEGYYGDTPDALPNFLNTVHFGLHAISGAAYLHALLIFPDGKLVPRWLSWLPVVLYGVAGVIIGELFVNGSPPSGGSRLLGFLLRPSLAVVGGIGGVTDVHAFDVHDIVITEVIFFVLLFGMLIPLIGVFAQVYRYQSISTAEERQQTKIVVWALGLAFGAGVVFLFAILMLSWLAGGEEAEGIMHQLEDLVFQVFPLLYAIIPLSLIVSIQRYRLWDIDFVINRSMVYGGLTVLLGVVFAGGFFGVRYGLERVLGGEQAVFAATVAALLVAGLFSPVRTRLRRYVDRRFYGIKLDYVQAIKVYDAQAQATKRHAVTKANFGGYTDLTLLGRGGMAEVYLAAHPDLEQQVAIKMMPAHLAEEVEFRKRFAREVQALVDLEHMNIVDIHEAGEHDGIPYMVMEYVDGYDLAELIVERKRLPLEDALPILRDVAAALDHAHAQGIIHRDIKPSNVMIETSPNARPARAVLMDFGIAKVYASSTQLTGTGGMVGTLDYVAPEQIQGDAELDSRADIYSLGVMAYQMLTGELPFKKGNPGAMVMAHLMEPAPDPCQITLDLPEFVGAAIMTAMAKEPEVRFETAGEMVMAMGQAV